MQMTWYGVRNEGYSNNLPPISMPHSSMHSAADTG